MVNLLSGRCQEQNKAAMKKICGISWKECGSEVWILKSLKRNCREKKKNNHCLRDLVSGETQPIERLVRLKQFKVKPMKNGETLEG